MNNTTATETIIRNTDGLIECYLPGSFVAVHDAYTAEHGVLRGHLVQTYVPGDAWVTIELPLIDDNGELRGGTFTETILNPILVCEAAR